MLNRRLHSREAPVREPISYQLWIEVSVPLRIAVGRLGLVELAPGRYVYTGSAKRALESRIARHLCGAKTLRWHIDYLLHAPGVRVTRVSRSNRPECQLQQATPGQVPVLGFGSSDCHAGCGSHLKYLGK